MEYETVITYDHDKAKRTFTLVDMDFYPVDIYRLPRVRSSRVLHTYRSGFGRRSQPVVNQSLRQDALTTGNSSSTRGPKTRSDTNEFIRAFWVNGEPKCREGYRYDFSRKMCRLIK